MKEESRGGAALTAVSAAAHNGAGYASRPERIQFQGSGECLRKTEEKGETRTALVSSPSFRCVVCA